jgi:hypothetical protein
MRAVVHNHPVIPREPSSQEGFNGDKLIAEADLVRNVEVKDEDGGHPRVDSLLQVASPPRDVRSPSANLPFSLILSHHFGLPEYVPVLLDNHDTIWTGEPYF